MTRSNEHSWADTVKDVTGRRVQRTLSRGCGTLVPTALGETGGKESAMDPEVSHRRRTKRLLWTILVCATAASISGNIAQAAMHHGVLQALERS